MSALPPENQRPVYAPGYEKNPQGTGPMTPMLEQPVSGISGNTPPNPQMQYPVESEPPPVTVRDSPVDSDADSDPLGGYDVKFDPPLPPLMCCGICGLGLKVPIQVPCTVGHRFCKKCYESVVGSDDPCCPLDSQCVETTHLDTNCRREIENWNVFCANAVIGCQWRGCLRDLEGHTNDCDFRMRACPNSRHGCEFSSLKANLAEHVIRDCRFKAIRCTHCGEDVAEVNEKKHVGECPAVETSCPAGCGTRVPRQALSRHLADNCPMSLESCVYEKYGCTVKSYKMRKEEHMKECAHSHIDLLTKIIDKEREEKAALAAEVRSLRHLVESLDERFSSLAQLQAETLKSTVEKLCHNVVGMHVAPLSESLCALEQRVQLTEETLPAVKAKADGVSKALEPIQVKAKTSEQEVAQVTQKISEVQIDLQNFKQITVATEAVLNTLDFRTLSLELTSYHGVYVWKIPDYTTQAKKARAGTDVALLSPPFYTSRHGYKMCARLYPNGDGMGKGSHLGVFFVVMRGEYDALLKWPFQQKVTFTLIDQSLSAKHITDTFIPDPVSNSFERPTSEMNIASGCPRFVPVETIHHGRGYIKDDALFLRIAVNTAGLSSY